MTSTYIYLNTADAIETSNPADSRFTLNFQNYGNNKTFISLEQTTIPITTAPINSNNNTIELAEDNGGLGVNLVTLDERSYTGDELATELSTKLTALSPFGNTYTAVYNAATKKLTITADTWPFRFSLLTTAFKVMGFDFDGLYTLSKTSQNVVRLDGSTYYDIISSLSSRNICSNGRTNVLARIPIFSGFSSIQTYQHMNDSKIEINNRDVDVLNLFLVDDQGNRLTMPRNSDISYVFKLTFQ